MTNTAEKLIGTKITSSTAIDVPTRAPRDHTVMSVHHADDGSWMAWSARADGKGEHLRGATPEKLARRIMSLA